MKNLDLQSIYDGATSTQERRAREKFLIALTSGQSSQREVVQAIHDLTAHVAEMVEIMREWQLEDADSSVTVN